MQVLLTSVYNQVLKFTQNFMKQQAVVDFLEHRQKVLRFTLVVP